MKFVIYFTEDDTQLSLLALAFNAQKKIISAARVCNFRVMLFDVQQTQKHILHRLRVGN